MKLKTRIGTHLGSVQGKVPFSSSLHKLANSIVNERVVKPTTGRGSGRKKGEACNVRRRFSAEDKSGERCCDLAREFKMHTNQMYMLLNGLNYAWVRDPA